MAEAVIVAVARSPIGRAFNGSLKDLRPDDLTACTAPKMSRLV
jgi:acetyl-CoA C-acetyltransferase